MLGGGAHGLVLFAPTLFFLQVFDVLVEFVEMLSLLGELFFELAEAAGLVMQCQSTEKWMGQLRTHFTFPFPSGG